MAGAAQTYSLETREVRIQVDSIELKGYEIAFTHPFDQVKKAWWRYIKNKAVLENMVSHYELKIPAEKGRDEVLLVSKTIGSDSTSTCSVQLALRHTSIEKEQLPALYKGVSRMLIEFKTSFLLKPIEQGIKEQERQSAKLSRALSKFTESKKSDELSDAQYDSLVYKMTSDLETAHARLEQLKAELKKIK